MAELVDALLWGGSDNCVVGVRVSFWNFKDMNAFFIHSSNANTELKYSWLVSNLFVVNACSPDAGTGLKNVTQSLDSYQYTYKTPGTYTATFVATNGNYKQESSVVREYKVMVTE